MTLRGAGAFGSGCLLQRLDGDAKLVDISWVLGDAEELPFDQASFDAVTSNFGAVFAPRHTIVGRELARVCRPGRRIVITA
jgi:ubiquinone/menaquinone biosynthesis C-methylase UbiE